MNGRLALSAAILVLGLATVAGPVGRAGQAATEPDSESAHQTLTALGFTPSDKPS